MNLLTRFGNWSVSFNVSWIFPKPAAAPLVPSPPESAAIAQMNSDIETTLAPQAQKEDP